MKFMITWNPPTGEASFEMRRRFVENGGAMAPGLTLIGRWMGLSGQGVAIVEATDEKALMQERLRWSDLMPFQITPCVDNEVLLSSVRQVLKEPPKAA
jgi:Protein of unknown function (DUF3303)